MRRLQTHSRYAIVSFAATTLLAGCVGDGPKPEINAKPPNIGTITKVAYDGASDDLLTAGLGKTGLPLALPSPAGESGSADGGGIASARDFYQLYRASGRQS